MSKKIPLETFLPAYIKAYERGLTKEEFAEEIGLKPNTVYQRIYELRKDVDPTIPLLPTRHKQSISERAKAILDQIRKGEPTKAKPKAKKPEAAPASDGEDLTKEEQEALSELFG
jgi:hypothetical protein